MAITLDELLGRNQNPEPSASTESFPSYREYEERRAQGTAPLRVERPVYNFDPRPYTPPRSVESARAYEASRPYVAPRANEYRAQDYTTVVDRRLASPETDRYAAPERDRYASEAEYAETYGGYRRDEARPQSLYEFTVNDAERASDDELYDRLSASTTSAYAAEREQAARASYAENYAERYRAENKKRRKLHLGLKAKLIIAAYVVVVVLVAVLVIVNAGSLNRGTAKVPSGAQYTSAAELEAHNTTEAQIDFGHEDFII